MDTQPHFDDEVCCDEVSFLHSLRSMKKGRARGEDGLAVEFVQAMSPDQISGPRHSQAGRRFRQDGGQRM